MNIYIINNDLNKYILTVITSIWIIYNINKMIYFYLKIFNEVYPPI